MFDVVGVGNGSRGFLLRNRPLNPANPPRISSAVEALLTVFLTTVLC